MLQELSSGKVSIASNASDPSVVVDLSGTATTSPSSALTATPSSITFGNVVVGTESSQTIRLANSGTASVTVSSLAPSVSTVSVSGITVPLTLGSRSDCEFHGRIQTNRREQRIGRDYGEEQRHRPLDAD